MTPAKTASARIPSQRAMSPRENQNSSAEDRYRSTGAKTHSVTARESPGRMWWTEKRRLFKTGNPFHRNRLRKKTNNQLSISQNPSGW